MKLTKSSLKQIIKEELNKVLNEAIQGRRRQDPRIDCPDLLQREEAYIQKYGQEAVNAVYSCQRSLGRQACGNIDEAVKWLDKLPKIALRRNDRTAMCLMRDHYSAWQRLAGFGTPRHA